jgi:SAM-dependent methyltransferase
VIGDAHTHADKYPRCKRNSHRLHDFASFVCVNGRRIQIRLEVAVGEYVFDQAWERERDRLRGLESLFDGPTIRYLQGLGVTTGWSCLEVGCGAGAVALWLAEQVGAAGRVVATDLDTRFIDGHGRANLDVRTHDILSGPPEEAAFDLVHARAVVEHIRDHDTALAHLLAAVRPGGWVLVEDVDFGGPMAAALARYSSPRGLAPTIERISRAGEAVFAAVGADASYGTQLVGALQAAGYQDVGGELHASIVAGGTEQWTRGTAEQLGEHFVGTGLVSPDDLARFLALSAEPTTHYAPPAMASAWGRRPTD